MGPTPAMRPVWLPVPATCEAVPPGPPNPKPLGLHPKIFRGFFPIAFGVGDDDIDQLQNILFAADVGEGVVFHALCEVDGVEDLDAVRLIDDLPAGIPHGLSVFVQLGGASPQHGSHLRQKLPFGIGDHIAAVHLHEGGFDEKPGLAAAAAADDQDIFVPRRFRVFWAAVHRQPLRLRENDVVLKCGIDVGLDVLGGSP